MSRRHVLVVAGTVAALVVGVGGTQLLPGAAPKASAKALTGYSGCDQLLAYYRSELQRTATAYGMGYGYAVDDTAAAGAPTAARSAAEPKAVGSGPTGTNLQEQGVDEPDLAKLQDGRLVVLTGNRVRILSASSQPEVLGSMRISGDQTYGGELLLDGNRAVGAGPGMACGPEPAAEVLVPRDGLPALHAGHAHHPGPPPRRLDRHAAADRGKPPTTRSTSAPASWTARSAWSPPPGRSRRSTTRTARPCRSGRRSPPTGASPAR